MAGPSQYALLVIVLDVDFEGMATLPPKCDAVLIVDANAVPAGTVALQGFKAISRRHEKIVETRRRVEQLELSLDAAPQRLRNSPGRSAVALPKEVSGSLVAKRLNHTIFKLHASRVMRQGENGGRATRRRHEHEHLGRLVLGLCRLGSADTAAPPPWRHFPGPRASGTGLALPFHL